MSYVGLEGSILRDLEGNVARYSSPAVVVADSAVAQDSAGRDTLAFDSVFAEPNTLPRLEIRRKLTIDGKEIDR